MAAMPSMIASTKRGAASWQIRDVSQFPTAITPGEWRRFCARYQWVAFSIAANDIVDTRLTMA